MMRLSLVTLVAVLGLIGCNGHPDDRPLPRREGGVHVDAPGVNGDIERGNKKVNVDVNPK